MAELLRLGVLDDREKSLHERMSSQFGKISRVDELHEKYYEGRQRLEHIGLAVPPELRRFETVVNIPRVAVDEVERRLDVKSLMLPGSDTADDGLREGWDANNLDSESPLLHKDALVFGRGFVTVGSNEDDSAHPLITVEPTRQMTCLVDRRKRSMLAAMRVYRNFDGTRCRTLYLPDSTLWLEAGSRGWAVVDRDDHGLGRVPVVLFLNRRRAGHWDGTSEMADVMGLTDSVARTLTNMAVAAEVASIPQKWVSGVSQGDFVDPDSGEPLPAWETYFGAIMATQNPEAKFGQFGSADLKNFHDSVDHLMVWAANLLGLPTRYFGQDTVNPAAEGAIRADEARLVKNAERKQMTFGDGWGWVMGLYERFRTGEWLDANRLKVEWHDAGTPTFAQRADAIQKLAGGVPILSRQGAWDELGWSDTRKSREIAYFDEESANPYLDRLREKDVFVSDGDGAASEFAEVGAAGRTE